MDGMDEVDIRGKQMGLIENMKRAWAAFRESPSTRPSASSGLAQGAKSAKPDYAESASMRDDLWATQWRGPSDEIMMLDPILQLSGTDQFTEIYDVYREMLLKWPHARHCLRKRQNAVLARPLQIMAASDENLDAEIAEFARETISGIYEFRDDLRELLDAIWFGFAVSEIMWKTGGRGRNGQNIIVDRLMSRDPGRFRFDWDCKLMIDDNGVRQSFTAAPEDKFIVHSYNKEHEIPYGWGEARYCYWYYFFAKNGLKFWSIFTEKFASPTAVGKYPPGISDAEKQSLLNTLRAMQNDQAVRIPDNMVIELLEAQRAGSLDCYQNFIRYLELSVSKAILGGTLTSDEGQFGTRAQAEVHEASRIEYTEADCESLAGAIKSQLITPLVRFNYGFDAAIPDVTFASDDEEFLESRARTDEMLVRMGVPLSVKYFYETYKRPAPEAGDEVTAKLRIANSELPFDHSPRSGHAEFGETTEAAVADKWTKREERFIEAAVSQGKRFYFELMKQIIDMFEKSADEQSVWAIRGEMFDVDTAPLANYLVWAIFTGELNGIYEIMELAKKSGKDVERVAIYAEANKGYVFEPLEPKEAIEWFEGLLPMTKEEFEGLLWGARHRAFTVADIQSKDIIGKVQDSLTKSLISGQTFGEWKKGIRQVFENEGVTEKSDFRMKTIFQTNIHNAVVEGRDMACEELVGEGIIKSGRWQSVGDSRVRDEHQALDGQVFAWDDVSVWRKLKSYNCRCQKVPVFN